MLKKLPAFVLLLHALLMPAQKTKILFIGNSYTYMNNLPQILKDMALSKGDSLIVDSYAIGGYRFLDHLNDPACLAKINQQQWDYVAIQDQSQWPSFPPTQVATGVYPFAKRLDSLILKNNPCSETIFYMTWGRKNGDASNCGNYPPLCTFNGMNARLRESYMQMAFDNHASVAPVGVAWKKVRDTYPALDLYQADESHPNIYGTYLTACVFYSTLFHKPATGAALSTGISAIDGLHLQTLGSTTVLDSLNNWQQHGDIPNSVFTYTVSGGQVQFTNLSSNATTYQWQFGDNSTGSQANPFHSYAASGQYTVSLTASDACKSSVSKSTVTVQVTVTPTGIDNTAAVDGLLVSPNPASDHITITHKHKAISAVKIINVLGALVFYKEVLLPQEQINIQNLSKGVYYLSVIIDNQTFIRKIVKD